MLFPNPGARGGTSQPVCELIALKKTLKERNANSIFFFYVNDTSVRVSKSLIWVWFGFGVNRTDWETERSNLLHVTNQRSFFLQMWRWLTTVILDGWEAAAVLTVNISPPQWMLRDGCADSPRTQGLRRRMNSQYGLRCCRFLHKHLDFLCTSLDFYELFEGTGRLPARLLYVHRHRALNAKCNVVIVVYREVRLPSLLWYCSEWSVLLDIWWL